MERQLLIWKPTISPNLEGILYHFLLLLTAVCQETQRFNVERRSISAWIDTYWDAQKLEHYNIHKMLKVCHLLGSILEIVPALIFQSNWWPAACNFGPWGEENILSVHSFDIVLNAININDEILPSFILWSWGQHLDLNVDNCWQLWQCLLKNLSVNPGTLVSCIRKEVCAEILVPSKLAVVWVAW